MAIDFGVNYLAIIVAAFAGVVIGFLYYGVAGLSERLAKINGVAPRGGPPSPRQGAIGIVVSLVNAWVLALLSLNLSAVSISDAIVLGLLVWLGFAAAFKAAQVAFEGRTWNSWALTAVHDVIVEVVAAVIVTLWR
jgi:hypothetical protein